MIYVALDERRRPPAEPASTSVSAPRVECLSPSAYLIEPGFSDPTAVAAIAQGVTSFAQHHGAGPAVCWRWQQHDPIPAGGTDVILALTPSDSLLNAAQQSGARLVSIHHAAHNGFAGVSVDPDAIGDLAATHLVDAGFSHLAFVGYSEALSRARYRGFCSAAARLGVRLSSVSTLPPRYQPQQRELLIQWLQRLEKPIGVFTSDDQLAVVLAHYAAQLHIPIPEHLGILGVGDGANVCESQPIPISSIMIDHQALGAEAARLGERLVQSHGYAREHIVHAPKGVAVRRSTVLSADDEDVRDALRLIDAGLREGVTVQRIVEQLNLSRSTLDRKFLRLMGRTVREELARRQVARACHLLLTTRLPICDIASRCGYGYLSNFTAAFRRATGQTPGVFRRQRQ